MQGRAALQARIAGAVRVWTVLNEVALVRGPIADVRLRRAEGGGPGRLRRLARGGVEGLEVAFVAVEPRRRAGAGLQHEHAKTGLGELLCHQSTGDAGTDDDHVVGFAHDATAPGAAHAP